MGKFTRPRRPPVGEAIAWGGPIVMNTQEELAETFLEYRRGGRLLSKNNRQRARISAGGFLFSLE